VQYITRRFKRYLYIAPALFGFLESAERSRMHFYQDTSRIKIGPIPDCYVETVGYALIAIAMLILWHRNAAKIFYLGWIPVTMFALLGVGYEFAGYNASPMGPYGVPMCFYTLALALVVWVLFRVARRNQV